MGAGSSHARIWRCRDPEQLGPEVVDAHGAELRRTSHHLRRVAQVERIADVAGGERDVHVLKFFGGGTNGRKVGFAGRWCRGRRRHRLAVDGAGAREGEQRDSEHRTTELRHGEIVIRRACLSIKKGPGFRPVPDDSDRRGDRTRSGTAPRGASTGRPGLPGAGRGAGRRSRSATSRCSR